MAAAESRTRLAAMVTHQGLEEAAREIRAAFADGGHVCAWESGAAGWILCRTCGAETRKPMDTARRYVIYELK